MKHAFGRRPRRPILMSRPVLTCVTVTLLSPAAPSHAARSFVQGASGISIPSQTEPTAGRWQTWLAGSVSDLRPPPPPSRNSSQGQAEFRELESLQAQRTTATNGVVQYW